jgi:hypothetical protein
MYVSVHVDEEDVLSEIDTERLVEELQGRKSTLTLAERDLKLRHVYEEFVRRGDAPKVLRDYIYEAIGRIL